MKMQNRPQNGDILAILESFKPLISKLSKNPLNDKKTKTTYKLKLTRDEEQEIYWELQSYFFEIDQKYDPTKGVYYSYYIFINLSWKANNLARDIILERENRADYELGNFQVLEDEEEELKDYSWLYEGLSCLSRRQREVIELHYFQGLKVSEVAKILGIKDQAVITHRNHAIEKLRCNVKKPGI
jgi:RNA polymerase sigma factor (sigma-70 family)